MSKIIVVSEFIDSSQNSTGYFWEKVIERLNDDGHDVLIISPKNNQGHLFKKFLIVRFIYKFYMALNLALRVAYHSRKFKIVFSGTNPETLFLILAILKKSFLFKWYVLVHDVFPENLVPAGIVSNNNIVYKKILAYYSRMYILADKLFVIGRDMRMIFKAKGVDSEKIIYIPNWVNYEKSHITNKESSKIIQDLGWQNRVVFQFFGNMGRVQGIDFLLNAISLVKSSRAAFLFIGSGARSELIKDFIQNTNANNVHYYGPLAQCSKYNGLSACDVSIVSLAKGMYGLGVPSKAYFSLSAQKPILAVVDEGSEIDLLIKDKGLGWSCPPNDPSALADTIDQICSGSLHEKNSLFQHSFKDKYCEIDSLDSFSREFSNAEA